MALSEICDPSQAINPDVKPFNHLANQSMNCFLNSLPKLKLLVALGCCLGTLSACANPEAVAPTKGPEAASSAPPAASSTQSAAAGKIDINKAPIAELDKLELPGTKPSLSERIQQGRPYTKAEDLVTKKVISSEELTLIKGLITTGPAK
jgi:DNA uptake protein ComE-like DNA-binding protein